MTMRSKKMMTMISKAMRSSTPSTFAVSALATSMVAMSSFAHAEQVINNVSVVQTSPAITQLRLGFVGMPVTPTAYQLDNPSRLVLDFNGVGNALPQRENVFNIGMVDTITSLDNDATTRLIVGLKNEGQYATSVSGNALVLTMTDPSVATQIVQPAAPVVYTDAAPATITPIVESGAATQQPVVQVQDTQAPADDTMVVRVNPLLNPTNPQIAQQYNYDGLTAVNYTGTADGGGNVSISLANEAIPVDVQRQGNNLVVRTTGTTVPRHLLRRLDVNGGLVASIDTKNQGQNGVVTINMTGDYEYQAYQSGNQLNISITQPELLREPTLEEKVYSGEPLSMEFQDVEIRSVLDILAQFTEMNIVASDTVSGRITLRLINVPWDQALDIILKSKNLGKRENGNVILVAPAVELAEQEAAELEAQQAVDEFSPLRTEYIRLSYAIATDVLNLISEGRNSGSSNNNNDNGTLLSSRGTVTVDERTNTLIVKDTSESIENIRALIGKIDIPVKQVMIEARIVSATDSFSKELGVSWGIMSNGVANNRNLLVGGSQQTLWDLKDYDIDDDGNVSYDISQADSLNVDLGIANPAGSIAFGLLSMSDLMIDLELSAMQADGKGEVISTPKVLTADKQTARVASGTQIPYQEAAASGATSTSFIEAALSLEVTPNITPDGKIGMALSVNSDSPNELSTGEYAINTNSVETNVIVEDGQTVVLGGIFRNTVSNNVEKVPFLGDLPYIGRLFKQTINSNQKEELLIFVTPKLINDGVSHIQ